MLCGASNLFEPLEDQSTSDKIHFEFYINPDDPVLAGHYPHQPLFPGVLLLEAMEKACSQFALDHYRVRIVLREIVRLSFLSLVLPGERIRLCGSMASKGEDMFAAQMLIEGDEPKAKSKLLFEVSQYDD